MPPYLTGRHDVTDAAELIERFGGGAGKEAGRRANRSRDIGNHLHFCRWRQIGRLIAWLEDPQAPDTVH